MVSRAINRLKIAQNPRVSLPTSAGSSASGVTTMSISSKRVVRLLHNQQVFEWGENSRELREVFDTKKTGFSLNMHHLWWKHGYVFFHSMEGIKVYVGDRLVFQASTSKNASAGTLWLRDKCFKGRFVNYGRSAAVCRDNIIFVNQNSKLTSIPLKQFLDSSFEELDNRSKTVQSHVVQQYDIEDFAAGQKFIFAATSNSQLLKFKFCKVAGVWTVGQQSRELQFAADERHFTMVQISQGESFFVAASCPPGSGFIEKVTLDLISSRSLHRFSSCELSEAGKLSPIVNGSFTRVGQVDVLVCRMASRYLHVFVVSHTRTLHHVSKYQELGSGSELIFQMLVCKRRIYFCGEAFFGRWELTL